MHRLSILGAVVTHVAYGTSREGFEAEWREIEVDTVEGDLINRCEKFDEADLDTAQARFDELSRPAPQLENAAARAWEQVVGAFNRRGIDNRSLFTVEAGDMSAFNRAVMEQLPNLKIYIEAVHRLTDLGAVVSHAAYGVSQEGFDAERRMIFIYMTEGDLITATSCSMRPTSTPRWPDSTN